MSQLRFATKQVLLDIINKVASKIPTLFFRVNQNDPFPITKTYLHPNPSTHHLLSKKRGVEYADIRLEECISEGVMARGVEKSGRTHYLAARRQEIAIV